MKSNIAIIGVLTSLALISSCASHRKLAAIKSGDPAASLVLGKDVYVPEIKETGEFEGKVMCYKGVFAKVKVLVEAEAAAE